MNTINKIWTAIKSAAAFVYKKLIGDAIQAVKDLIALKPLTEIPLGGLLQLSALVGLVGGTLLAMIFVAMFFPLSIWTTVFFTSAIYLELAKIAVFHHVLTAALGSVMTYVFEHLETWVDNIEARNAAMAAAVAV